MQIFKEFQHRNTSLIISELARRRILLLYFLLASVNFLLILFPLTNSLGYEFSVANSLILFLIGGTFAVSYSKKNGTGIFSFLSLKWKNLTIIVLVPFIIGFLASVFYSRCPIKDGLSFYLVITVPSFVYGIVSGFISSVISKRYRMVIFGGIFVSLLFIVLFEFYFNPQVYFYNPLFGFFPGTIYDEDIEVNWMVVLSQVYNLIFFTSVFISLKFLEKKKQSNFTQLISLGALLILFVLVKPFLGLATNSWRMNRELNSKVVTQHFEIMFSPDVNQNEKKFISLLHECYYEQVTEMLGGYSAGRINSFVFNSKDQKGRLFGAANANVAKPWLNAIFINKDYFPKSIKHEIVHVIASKFGYSPLKVADGFNPAMIEGMAMLVENDFDEFQADRIAKLAYNTGFKVNVNKLFSGLNFFSSYSSLAYIYSGAFLKYLYNEFGIEKIKKIYRNSDWKKIYGVEINDLVSRFEKSLQNENSLRDSNKAQLYFGGQTIFTKVCPRMTANDLNEANNNFVEGNYSLAAGQYRKIYNYSNSYSAVIGEVVSLIKLKNYSSANHILETEIIKFKTSQVYFNLLLVYGDTFALMKDEVNSSKYHDLLLSKSPHINYENEIKIRKSIIGTYGIDSLSNFLYSEKSKRLELIKMLNKEGIKYFSLPNLLYLAVERKIDQVNWLENIYKEFSVSTFESSYAAISISRYLLKQNNYGLAKMYAVKALDYKGSEDERYSAAENLRMVNWFCNNAGETKLIFN